MGQEFLLAAEQVLKKHQTPILVGDIVQLAMDNQLLKSVGKTPINTMRARLSEHIRRQKGNSIFIRTKANKFGLREWLSRGEINEYVGKMFEKNTSDEIVVCIRQELVDRHKRFFGFKKNYGPILQEISQYNNLVIVPRDDAKQRVDIKQLVSYVLLKDKKGRLLSFVRGNYGQKESLLKGVLCLGFGGHVNQKDLDLFGLLDGGITNCAIREVSEEIHIKLNQLRFLGIINDDSSPLGLNHFAFVFEARLPDNFSDDHRLSREMSINKLSLLTNSQIWNRFHELEFWSQLVVKYHLDRPKKYDPVFIKTKYKKFNRSPLLVVGEIGSGKSEVAKQLAEKNGLPLVSTRDCVKALTGIRDFRTNKRDKFQDKSSELISSPEGVEALARKIAEHVTMHDSKCVIIDGVRNIETYNILKQTFPNLNLLYIDVPRDTAYRLFSLRSAGRKVSIDEFRDARHHDVEREITLFKTRADAYLFNGGTLLDLNKAINKWWHERNFA